MSNHIHIVVKLHPQSIERLTDHEIAKRWSCLYKGPRLVQQWLQGEGLDSAQKHVVSNCIEEYRKRLMDLSWFMKCLNEPIALQANKEDHCTGHFWEARFKSQALLSEDALLSAMAYVDLNPVRAGMADTPEDSEHTSIKERITPCFNLAKAIKEQQALDVLNTFDLPLKPLLHFDCGVKNTEQTGILFSFEDYLNLVDYTGRCLRDDKRGVIPELLPPILQRLNIDKDTWLLNVTKFESIYPKRFSKRIRLRRSAA